MTLLTPEEREDIRARLQALAEAHGVGVAAMLRHVLLRGLTSWEVGSGDPPASASGVEAMPPTGRGLDPGAP